jgi:hypothetical protein
MKTPGVRGGELRFKGGRKIQRKYDIGLFCNPQVLSGI